MTKRKVRSIRLGGIAQSGARGCRISRERGRTGKAFVASVRGKAGKAEGPSKGEGRKGLFLSIKGKNKTGWGK